MWCSNRLHWSSVTFPKSVVLEIRCGLSSLVVHGFVRRVPVRILQDKLSWDVSPLGIQQGFHRQTHSVIRSNAVKHVIQRETKRQREKSHMRAHTVAEPGDTQQESSLNKFSTLTCGLCDELWFQARFHSAIWMSMHASGGHHV